MLRTPAQRHVLLVLLAFAVAGPTCEKKELVRVTDTAMPMGTYMAVTVYAPDEASGHKATEAVLRRVEEIEAALSDYRADSDLSKLCKAAGGPPRTVSRDLWVALRRSVEVSAETDGAFDPTVKPLVALWKAAWKSGQLPTDAELAAARALVDYRAIRLDPKIPQVQLLKAGVRLDLGGIGKGYAVDQSVAVLRQTGIKAALVALAGEIYALGHPPGREAWLIAIRDPNQPAADPRDLNQVPTLSRRLLLRDRAVSTSGDYEQFGMVKGHRYSHILDPRTGQPIEGMTSVTVIAHDSTTADAYATAFSVLGPEAALAFVKTHPDVELLILHQRQGKTASTETPGFHLLEFHEPNAP
jgi:thiamine biosynthesis lipoprotein